MSLLQRYADPGNAIILPQGQPRIECAARRVYDIPMPLSAAPATVSRESQRHPGLREIFTGFLSVGIMGFGGVLPLARRMIVEERGWLNENEFSDLLSLCQFLPGGNVINLSVATGLRFAGLAGALAGLLGLMAAPVACVILLGVIYERYQDSPVVRHMFAGLAAAAAGLIVAMAVKMAMPLRGKPASIVIAALSMLAVAVFRLPLLPTMLVLAPLSIWACWRFQR